MHYIHLRPPGRSQKTYRRDIKREECLLIDAIYAPEFPDILRVFSYLGRPFWNRHPTTAYETQSVLAGLSTGLKVQAG